MYVCCTERSWAQLIKPPDSESTQRRWRAATHVLCGGERFVGGQTENDATKQVCKYIEKKMPYKMPSGGEDAL